MIATLGATIPFAGLACSGGGDPDPDPNTDGSADPTPDDTTSSRWSNRDLPALVMVEPDYPKRDVSDVEKAGGGRGYARGTASAPPMESGAAGGEVEWRSADEEGDDATVVTESDGPTGTGSTELAERPDANQGPLKAGSRDDNQRFDEYSDYLKSHQGQHVIRFDVSERYVIQVVDEAGKHVPNASVQVGDGDELIFEGTTDAFGYTRFYPRAYGDKYERVEAFKLFVEGEGFETEAQGERTLDGSGTDTWTVTLPTVREVPATVPVNICFLVDTTGSMGDEIHQLQASLDSVVRRVTEEAGGNVEIRFGMVLYRDITDAYVTQVHDFALTKASFEETLAQVAASGGGDGPEDVQAGLAAAINELSWPVYEGLNLCFLVGDARPHLDYKDRTSYIESAMTAQRKGIKIFSLAASGLDDDGEYAFRQVAQLTGGQFLFLTYGESDSTPHDVGEAGEDYQSNKLDDVIVRSIAREMAAYLGEGSVVED